MKPYPLPVVRASASVAQVAYVHARSVERANIRKRIVGERLASADGLHVSRNLARYEVTEANAENINPAACRGGANPQHDAAQRTFERKDVGTAASYRSASRALASRIAEKHTRQARMRCDHLRAELITEVESAIGEFFAVRLTRFPSLASDLLARFACDALPTTAVRALHRVARRACDARMRRMGGKSKLVEPSFFNLFTDESAERSAELDAVFVNARVDYLLGLVRAKSSRHGCGRAAAAHANLLENAREYFLASIKGEACALPSAGLVPAVSKVGLNVSETRLARANPTVNGPAQDAQRFAPRALPSKGEIAIDPRNGCASSCVVVAERVRERKTRGKTRGASGASGASGAGGRLANSALYKRVLRLATFTGAQDVREALTRVTGKLTGAES